MSIAFIQYPNWSCYLQKFHLQTKRSVMTWYLHQSHPLMFYCTCRHCLKYHFYTYDSIILTSADWIIFNIHPCNTIISIVIILTLLYKSFLILKVNFDQYIFKLYLCSIFSFLIWSHFFTCSIPCKGGIL